LGIRAGLPSQMSMILASAVTIAIRYSLVRRQSEIKPNAAEPQILDFQTQQHKLFPLLARAYAYRFAGHSVIEMFRQVMAEVQNGAFSRLIEAHGLASGLKALTTTRATNGVEVCRLSCGGHGYSLAGNLPTLYADSVGAVTAEGEATVLLLQAARYLMKNCLYAQSNKRIDVYMTYLNPNSTLKSAKFDGTISMRSLLQAYEFRAAGLTVKVASRLQSIVAEGKLGPEEAWNQCAVQLVKAATAHTEYVIMRLFVERVENLTCDRATRRATEILCIVHGIYEVIENAKDFLQEGYLTGADVEALREKLLSLYQQVRVDAIAYVDAFNIDDRILRSCLGRYDGNVYESLYDFALNSKLNETQVHDSFFKYIQPVQSVSKL
jgi:acyl-CoA oxidase